MPSLINFQGEFFFQDYSPFWTNFIHTIDSFYVFPVAEILFWFGLTVPSGTDSALLYESLMKLKRKKDYLKTEGKDFRTFLLARNLVQCGADFYII